MLFGGNIRRAVFKIVQSLSLGTAGRQIFCVALQCVDSIDWPARVYALNFRPHPLFFFSFHQSFSLIQPSLTDRLSTSDVVSIKAVDEDQTDLSDLLCVSLLAKLFPPPLLFPSLSLSLPIFAGWHIVLFEWLKLN